jgi:hypothetical protein
MEYRRNIFKKNKESVIEVSTSMNIDTTWKSSKSSREKDEVIDNTPREEKIVVNDVTS